MRSSSSSGVLYAEDFDAPEPAAAPPEAARPLPDPVVLEPTFSLADLRRATERAERDARAQERQEAAETDSVRRSNALSCLADELAKARADAARLAAAAASATADTVFAMVAAVLPAFSAAQGAQEASALLRLLLPAMTHQSRLVIRVHPSLVGTLQVDLAATLEDNQTTVEWLASESMEPGDLSVRWEDGIMIRDGQALCEQVRALVMPDFAPTKMILENRDAQ